jgi:hypothetical protein
MLSNKDERLADDLIWGAKGISLEVLGQDTPKAIRKTFYLLENGLIKAQKVGNQWVARRSRLRQGFGGEAA